MSFDELIAEASQAYAVGNLDEAERAAGRALRDRPESADAMLLLGMVAERRRQPDVALPLLSRVAELEPSFHVYLLLSMVQGALGRPTEALASARQAYTLDPTEPRGLNQLGACCLKLQQWQDAADWCELALDLAPPNVPILNNLGLAKEGAGETAVAIKAYTHSLSLEPRQVKVLFRLGNLLLTGNQNAPAAECARRILAIDPVSASAHSLLATALLGQDKAAEALKHAQRAAKFAPDDALIVGRHGLVLQVLGQIEKADEQFRKSIELNPDQGFAYFALMQDRKVTEADRPIVEAMDVLAHSSSLATDQISDLQYGLGKAKDDLGEYDAAMKHLDKANRLVRKIRFGDTPFDRDAYAQSHDSRIRNFDSEHLEHSRLTENDDKLPIFVVGMIRSGTTLAEQILSSHPKIGAAGEQRYWCERLSGTPNSPEIRVEHDLLEALATQYAHLLRSIAPGKSHVVDKMPENFLHLAVLHCAFPRARIIHMRRHSVDTCLSIWATRNRAPTEWANDKSDLVFAYRQYLKLADHWRTVLPTGAYMEVQYADLVTDQEEVSRRMVEFCELDWDDACLRPQENPRAVSTPSAWQVRQPVYKTSVARWRKYEAWLGEFRQLLPASDALAG